jgi:hypothetical protein
MNDRMTELYASACLYARDKQLDRKPEDKDVQEFVKCMSEKFAELIVAECVQVIKDCEKYGHSLPLEFEVMNHFGVEE